MKDRLKSLTSSITSSFKRIPRRTAIVLSLSALGGIISSITSPFKRIPRRTAIVLSLSALGSIIFLALWIIPKWQVSSYRTNFIDKHYWNLSPAERTQLDREMLKAENDARVTLAQILGGFALLVGLYVSWRTLRVHEDGKITDRYSKAIELLGSERLNVRLGGIYALERIANDSLKDHWTIMEALTAFVRENSRKEKEKTLQLSLFTQDATQMSPSIPTDIQAALTVINRRKWRKREAGEQVINLSGSCLTRAFLSKADLSVTYLSGADLSRADLSFADLSGMNLSGMNLSGANLIDTHLSEAYLDGANLSGANLSRADLSRANLSGANLSGADLIGVDLIGADLSGANLSRADLRVANLSRADLSRANLSGANLSGANLLGANLLGADLSRADLSRADLSRAYLRVANLFVADLSGSNLLGADLREVRYLTRAQIKDAITDDGTNLPLQWAYDPLEALQEKDSDS
jgi:uncharacterized protein YjbI with pentapeptide repeats